MSRHTQPPRLSVAPPATAEEGAAQVRALLVPLFDRRDGSGEDWSLMLESLFRARFQITDGRFDDEARRSFLRRVHEGSYSRLAGNSDAAEAVPSLSNTDVLKSSPSHPPK